MRTTEKLSDIIWKYSDIKNAEAIKLLDELAASVSGRDPEEAHVKADEVLLFLVDPEVRAAYERVVEACRWWAYA